MILLTSGIFIGIFLSFLAIYIGKKNESVIHKPFNNIKGKAEIIDIKNNIDSWTR